jgi:uncharacterized protein (DUF58 family)
MMLSAMAVSGMLSEQTMRRLRVQRELPSRIFAGVPVPVGVRVTNGKPRLPSFAVHVVDADPAGGTAARHFLLKVAAAGREVRRHTAVFPSRGWRFFPGLRISTRFPFGLFVKISRPILQDAVLVYPAIRPLQGHEVPAVLQPGWRERRRRGQGAGLHNIRPYRPGDDPRLLHWKTSARAGELLLKELEDEDRPRLRLVVLDPLAGTSAALVEADLSYAASVAAHAIRRGVEVEVVTPEAAIGSGQGEAHLDRILEALALYATPKAPRPIRIPPEGGREVRIQLGSGAAAAGARA